MCSEHSTVRVCGTCSLLMPSRDAAISPAPLSVRPRCRCSTTGAPSSRMSRACGTITEGAWPGTSGRMWVSCGGDTDGGERAGGAAACLACRAPLRCKAHLTLPCPPPLPPPGDDPNFRGRGNRSSGDIFSAAPNIDHSQEFVKRDLQGALGAAGRAECVRLWGFWAGLLCGLRRAAVAACSRTAHPCVPAPAAPLLQSGWCGCARTWALTAGASTSSRWAALRTAYDEVPGVMRAAAGALGRCTLHAAAGSAS